MKTIVSIFLAITLAVCPAFALQKTVASVSASSSVIFTPGAQVQWVTIANTGSGGVYLSFDGTAATSAGYPLAAGSSICVVYAGSTQKWPIRAILQSGTTTTLNINTPDTNSQ